MVKTGSTSRSTKRVSFLSATLTVLAKDLRIELSTREIVTTAGFFAALVAIMATLAFVSGAERASTRVAPGAMWLAIAFAAVLALGRTWQRERDESALLGLVVSPIPRAAIWCGKALGVFGFLVVVEIIVVPLVALLCHVDLGPVLVPLVVVVLGGTVGVAAMGTLFGVMTVRTSARELILATVLFPLLSPALLSSVSATREVFLAAANGMPVDTGEVGDWLRLLAVFDVVAVAGGLGLFGQLLED
jgi:heme exporter protein B